MLPAHPHTDERTPARAITSTRSAWVLPRILTTRAVPLCIYCCSEAHTGPLATRLRGRGELAL